MMHTFGHVPSENKDQSVSLCGLIRIFTECILIAKDASLLYVDNEDSDQTVCITKTRLFKYIENFTSKN